MNIICFLLQMPSPSFSTLYVPRRWKLCQGIHFLVTFNQDQVLAVENTEAKVPVLLLSPRWLLCFFVLFYFILFCQWPQLLPAVFLHSCMLQRAVADIPNSSRPKVGTALASNNPGPLYYPFLAPILQKLPLVAASQVLSLSEPSASCSDFDWIMKALSSCIYAFVLHFRFYVKIKMKKSHHFTNGCVMSSRRQELKKSIKIFKLSVSVPEITMTFSLDIRHAICPVLLQKRMS